MSEPAQPVFSPSGPSLADEASRRISSLLSARPETWVAVLIFAQLLFWTLEPWWLATSLPLDVVSNGLAWGHEWQWGYYKHPPLPSWTVEFFFDALGDAGPFLLSQIAISATYMFVFLLGREFLPVRMAAVGTGLLACIYYFSIPTPEFNHNVAQMPVWAAASFAYYKALKTRRLRWWLALGAAAGIGLLTKYATAVLLLAVALHMLSGRRTRSVFLTPGPWAALVLCVAVVSPHLFWLLQNHFPTLSYAVQRAGHAEGALERFMVPIKFLLAQFLDMLPALVVCAIAGIVGPNSVREFARRSDEDFRFLMFLTLGPPVLTALLSLVTGLGIRDMWGAPMWNLTGLLVVLGASSRWPRVSLPRVATCVTAVFCCGLAGYALAQNVVPGWERKPSRTQWPDRALAQTFSGLWTSKMHRQLDIVAGDEWLAGLIAMRASPRPSVWVDGSSVKSPWITPQAIAHDGALVVWRIGKSPAPPPALAALPNFHPEGMRAFAWPQTPKAQPLRIGYGFVMPADAS